MSKADFTVTPDKTAGDVVRLALKGDWTAVSLRDARERLRTALKSAKQVEIDHSELKNLDTAGAYVLKAVLKDRAPENPFPSDSAFHSIYDLVSGLETQIADLAKENTRKSHLFSPATNFLASIGRASSTVVAEMIALSVFIGRVVSVVMLSIINPKRIRLTPLFSQMQRVGIEALLVVGVTNFFVGAVIAFLGVVQLQQFGASVFAVELIGISVLREFGPVIAAVLMAGRSASSFTAEIGAMKMNQEIDAMRVMGISPFDALILPRMFALLLMMPLASFVGMLAGLLGGQIVVWTVLGYGPNFFVQRLLDFVPFVNYFVGMIKTPFFAISIAVIGCHLGMTVTSDVISLGRQVTKSVVQAIFTIILINALIAMMFNGFDFK